MVGVTAKAMLRAKPWRVILPLAAILAGSSGCAAREPCYQVVAVMPASGDAIVFDACRGRFETIEPPAPPKRRRELPPDAPMSHEESKPKTGV